MSRIQTFQRICGLIGAPLLRIDPRDGWPGYAELQLSGQVVNIAMHVSLVGSHSRKPYEYRFQNPADKKAVTAPERALPMLVGLSETNAHSVLVVVDGSSRVGRESRFSILFHQNLLIEARSRGWAKYISNTGETIYGINPSLFPTLIETVIEGIEIPSKEISEAVIGAGLLDKGLRANEERARRASQSLVRYYAFSRNVRQGYNDKCAMCGMTLGIVVGAHIYPATAPGSQDIVTNGLPLCENHHSLFDKHMIWIDPDTRDIILHPLVHREAEVNPSVRSLVGTTFQKLADARSPELSARPENFVQRYNYFEGLYKWATG